MRQIYNKPTWGLLIEAALKLPSPFSKQDIVDWFSDNYPKTQKITVISHITSCCVNDKNRKHYNCQKDILYKRPDGKYEKYNPQRHSVVISQDSQRDIAEERNGVYNEQKPKKFGERHTSNESELISNIDYYYRRSLEVFEKFGGPSVYFHLQSIIEQEIDFLSDRHIEMIYATLASWGMNRMGNPEGVRAKIVEFSKFKESILYYRDKLQMFRYLGMDSCTQEQYEKYIDDLKPVYFNLQVSESEATIVAHSKTLAHILPNLIPPIDRHHTARFFIQDKGDFSINLVSK